jgi:peptidoglycan/xylan/chitin deacetylase (PgdA/CDA1 family)
MLAPLFNSILRNAARYHRSKPFAMRNGAPLVSFTFDDVPDSACTNGAAVLEGFGIRGTFYVASGICGIVDTNWRVIARDQVRALHDRGHELGCHTYSHVGVDKLGARALDEECQRNLETLRTICGDVAVTNFCYPFGRASLPRKLQLEARFDSCRGIYEGVNVGTVDLGLLKVVELYDRTLTAAKLERVIGEARERNGWLIFYTHDVADPPSWIGCSTQLLRATVEAVQAAQMPCLTIRQALTAIGYPARGDVAVPLAASR